MSSSTAQENFAAQVDETWEPVCLVDDLVNESGVCVLFEYRQVALFYLKEKTAIYAIANHDPFSKANVLSRGIVGTLQGKLVVASPIFKQHFCLESGQCLEDETVTIDTWSARIEGNKVYLKHTT